MPFETASLSHLRILKRSTEVIGTPILFAMYYLHSIMLGDSSDKHCEFKVLSLDSVHHQDSATDINVAN